jgi:hypothetical protein
MFDLRLARAELPGDGRVDEATKVLRVTAQRSGPGSEAQRDNDSRSRGMSAAFLRYGPYSRGSEQWTAWTARTVWQVQREQGKYALPFLSQSSAGRCSKSSRTAPSFSLEEASIKELP